MSDKSDKSEGTQKASNVSAKVVAGLNRSLAETSVTQMKAQNYHWNVEGMAFGPLHDLFGKIYEDHFEAVDELAERIRALGAPVDGRYEEFLKVSSVGEASGKENTKAMLEKLEGAERQLSQTLRDLAETAEQQGDIVTTDMAIARAQVHDKFAWMLGAHLKD